MPEGELLGNDYVADLVADRPDLFAGVGSVPLDDPMAAVREVRRCVEDLGFVAIRVVPWLWELPPDDRRYYPSASNRTSPSACRSVTPGH